MASNWPPKARDTTLIRSCVLVCPLAVFNLTEGPVSSISLNSESTNLSLPTMWVPVPVSPMTQEGH
eukprot:11119996-Heterocapsa_arctica.AAC.1